MLLVPQGWRERRVPGKLVDGVAKANRNFADGRLAVTETARPDTVTSDPDDAKPWDAGPTELRRAPVGS